MKKFFKEFKEFALKGNMIDLAVGMIIGAAFNKIVSSLVNDIIMPVLGIFTGKMDFGQLFVALDGNHYETLAEAEAAGAACIRYGAFISGVIDFIIMALVVFLIVRQINRVRNLTKKKEVAAEEQKPTKKICPFCRSEIAIEATRCPHCTSQLDVKPE
jgi:large conductance mechanosensitive channel